jgi:tRNA (adenine37-N6)-methyltransferase
MNPILYHPIGRVISPFHKAQPPEAMRGDRACLELEPGFADAVSALKVGQLIWVLYHLHQVKPDPHQILADLITRRISQRPNPVALTLAQVVHVQGTQIEVVGLDAIDGSPILDIKPYQAIWDAPPVIPTKHTKTQRAIIALTGGPGGGKSSLIEDLRNDPDWAGCFVTLPEAVQYARFLGISPGEKLFQRSIVHLQIGLEDGLGHALGEADPRPILCHRGSLDPIAFWRQRGWDPDEFYTLVGLSRQEHYQRYTGVIHLVTAADGVPSEYTRWPHAHRPEEASQAIQLDRWLAEAWGDHPHYYRLDNLNQDWASKSQAARAIMAILVGR